MFQPSRRSAALGLFAAGAAVTSFRPAFAAGPGVTFQPFAFKLRDGTVLDCERGTLPVPEDRANPRSRTLPLTFVRLRSTSPTPGSPIVYLAGGPGGSGLGTANGPRQPIFLALRAVADVIILDQRGTGASNIIPPWSEATPDDLSAPFNERSFAQAYRAALAQACASWKAAGVAIKGYTTVQSADDLEDLRRALGARKLDLWGISYGTHLALAAMRRHPGSFGRVALSSVEGMAQTVKLPAAVDAAMDRMFAAASRPDFGDIVRRVHARFDAAPVRLTAKDASGTEVGFVTDSFLVRLATSFMPKNPSGFASFHRTYLGLDAGETGMLGGFIYKNFLASPLSFSGMPEAMDIASGITDARLALVDRQTPRSYFGRALNIPMPQMRGAIPGVDLGDAYRREITSDIPTLVFSGDLDMRTPLEEQNLAIAGLRRRHQVIVRNGGHDLYEAHPDIPGMLAAFFAGRPVTQTELTLPPPTAG